MHYPSRPYLPYNLPVARYLRQRAYEQGRIHSPSRSSCEKN
jgi:hypothetical protein